MTNPCAKLAAILAALTVGLPSARTEPSLKPTHYAERARDEAAVLGGEAPPPEGLLTLWYRQPARNWNEALPVGNGRLGAMVFGGVARETVQLNEDSLWEGYKREVNNPEALPALPEVRRLLFAGKSEEAAQLIGSKMMAVPPRIRSYQPLGSLDIEFPGTKAARNYRRELDLASGIASVRYEADGATFTREVFASFPDNAVVMRISCDRPGRVNFNLGLSRQQDARTWVDPRDARRLILRGRIMAQYGNDPQPVPAMRFEAQVQVIPEGGNVSASGDRLAVANADSVVLVIAGATDYRGGNPASLCADALARASARAYAALRRAHVEDHRRLFARVDLELGAPESEAGRLPTDERLKRFAAGAPDPGLMADYFQYGRYLLMASSRPGSLPANLQGIWNAEIHAAWNSDYHTNINIQMNYWPAEVCNLSECHEPLFDLMDALVAPGSETARAQYGAGGWVVHHLTDPFGFTAPADGPPGVWPMGAAWLAQHPWEHYRFTQDREFLERRAYPLMKGAARFILDFLVTAPPGTPVAGRLVTAPSFSPENKFKLPGGGAASFTYGSTMDLEIIHDLLSHCVEASQILGTDEAFREECAAALKRLAPLQISPRDGRLQEWIEDYDEVDPHHRHTSHLFAVYPGDQITLGGTPELAAAARKSLEARGDKGATEWSLAWRTCLWARFHEGERAYGQLRLLIGCDLYPNLFNRYPPFQIDGNLGATAGIAEMLVQSEGDEIDLLPALPSEWADGSVRGLRARGAFEIGMSWRQGRLTQATLLSNKGGSVRVRAAGPFRVTEGGREIPADRPESGVAVFLTRPGAEYALVPDAAPVVYKRPRILGVSHAAFYVNDLAKARAFYEGFLGFAEPFSIPRKNGGELVWIKINDRQSIELFPGSEVAPNADRLYHVALEVDDAEAMRVYLRSRGVAVPPATPIGRIGNKNYFVKDPNGNIVEIVQYMPDGWTALGRGKFMPDTRIATHMSHAGIMVGQFDASMKFYGDILGMKEFWRGSAGGKTISWVNMRVPDGEDYLEFMLYDKMPTQDRMLSMHHICLEVDDAAKAQAILKTRTLPAGCKPPTELKVGVNQKRQINYFNPDGTRVEIMERGTVTGAPAPWSPLPAPAPLPST